MKIRSSLCALLSLCTLQATENLGTLNISSSTIDDKYTEIKNEVSSSTLLTAEEVEKIHATNVEDILNTIPGITSSNVGNDRVKIHIRGIDNQMYMGEKPGVAIVIDGIPVQKSSGKINLDLDNIASIKVIKGSASYLYGNDAIGGAIVITTKRPKGLNKSKIETEFGSFGFKRFLASTNQSFETGALQIQGTTRDTDGYWDDAYLKHKSVNGKYQYYLSETSDLTFGMDYTKRETGDGTSVHGETQALKNPTSVGEVSYSGFYDTTLLKTFLTYSNDIDNNSNLMINVSRYEDDTVNLSAATDTNGDGINDDHKTISDEEWIQNTFKSEYRKSFDKVAIMAGIDLARNEQENTSIANLTVGGFSPQTKGDLTGSSNNDEDINAIYFEVQNQLTNNLTSTINFRHDNIKYDYINNLDTTLNTALSYNANSYRVGFNYKLNDTHNMYTSYATGFRAPTAEQISENIEKLQTDSTLNIQTDLDIETTSNIEVGIKGDISSFKYDASIYQLDRKDYIGRRAGSYIWSSDDDADESVGNLGDMRSRGFELALNSDRKKMASFSMAYTYLDATFKKYTINPNDGQTAINLDGNIIPRTSKHTLNLTVDFRPINGLTISPELIAKSSYYADESNLYKQPGYEVVNLRTEYKINKTIEIFGKIKNLLNKKYNQFVTVGYGDDMEDATIRVAATRSYYAGLRYKF
jgi:iron complex outermembrane receptor protein